MLKPDWKQNIILLVFAGIMFEHLTLATLVLLATGLGLVFFEIRPTKLVRNIFALMIFISYWITYGKFIDPEVGLNFLTSIIILKILEKETVRDRYMIFFGLILLISAGSLFERSITYVIFFSFSFLILIKDFYSYLNQSWRLKDLGYSLIWVMPLTFALFFFIPRMLNPLPFQQGKPTPGEIGYTPDVNISQIDSLTGNATPVFQALVNKKINQGNLYWRGNTLSTNDGWNWTLMSQDRASAIQVRERVLKPDEIKQTIRIFNQSDFFFALDVPETISYGRSHLELTRMKTLQQNRWQWIPRYEAISAFGSSNGSEAVDKSYLQVPLPKNIKKWVEENFKGRTLREIEEEVRNYFRTNQFSYSLSPGPSRSFEEFFRIKKIGFCSHYASAVAIILRIKGIPTRLVSGFMGGNYNRFAEFYLVSQNDAHVWVEAFDNGKWGRLDPTEWIAPDRVRLGGEAFMESVKGGSFQKNIFFKMPRIFFEMKQWFAQWDFHFYMWLEEMDYHAQEAWLLKFNFKRKWLYSLIPLITLLFIGLYILYISRRKYGARSPLNDLWNTYFEKMRRNGLLLSPVSVKESLEILIHSSHPKKEQMLSILKDLIHLSFSGEKVESENLKKRMKKL